MQYRMLVRTGLRVSEIGCGVAPLSIPHYNEVWDPYAEETTSSVIAALQRVVELGCNAVLPNVTVFTHLESLDEPASWQDTTLDRADPARRR